jgi:hypothetical protein
MAAERAQRYNARAARLHCGGARAGGLVVAVMLAAIAGSCSAVRPCARAIRQSARPVSPRPLAAASAAPVIRRP